MPHKTIYRISSFCMYILGNSGIFVYVTSSYVEEYLRLLVYHVNLCIILGFVFSR